MSTLPTARERKELDKLPRMKHVHFIVLVVLIGIACLAILFPSDVPPSVVILVGVSIFVTGMSAMSLQYFQRCPRCSARISRGKTACAGCGLEFYATRENSED